MIVFGLDNPRSVFYLLLVIGISCVAAFRPGNLKSPINKSWSSAGRSLSLLHDSTGVEYRPVISPRVQKMKDITLQKEILRDITTSEFALQLEVKNSKESKIDYKMLISKLDQHLEFLQKRNNDVDSELIARILRTKDSLFELKLGVRSNLELVDIADAGTSKSSVSGMSSNDVISSIAQQQELQEQQMVEREKLRELKESLKLIVREDGSVDWEGASAAGQEVAKFGTELWERLNGKEETEGFPSFSDILGQVQAKELVTEEITVLAKSVSVAKDAVNEMIKSRDQLKAKLRQERKDGSSISDDDIQSLKLADVRVKELEKRSKLFTLDLDIERICVYLQQELESSIEPSDQRVFIAEVGLIEKQLQVLLSGLKLETDGSNLDLGLVSLVDDDELALLFRTVDDLKNRLGLDAQSQKVDWGTLGVLGSESISKLKEGLDFYGEGTKILFNDLEYARLLLTKAVQGSTLKPREVNAVRRTGKDLLTLIPTTIILIIPLSPVGHVLVFSFIQRFFPDFFPSCYTEKRLNLRRLYAEIERKNDDDLLGEEEKSNEWGLWTSPMADSMSKLSATSVTGIESFTKLFATYLNNEGSDKQDKDGKNKL